MHCFISTDNGPHYHNSGFLFYLAEANQVFDLNFFWPISEEKLPGDSRIFLHDVVFLVA